MLSIAAAELMDPTEIASSLQSEVDHNDEEDEEKYLDSGDMNKSDKLSAQLKKWIDTSVTVANSYASAADQLLEKGMRGKESEQEAGRLCEEVTDVVVGACANHTHNTLAWGTVGHPKDGLDTEK
jgi:hypothetical protein